MKQRSLAKDGIPALDLIEEAFYCVRQIPLATTAAYLVCTLPFLLALLFFWAEMSTHPNADRQLSGWLIELTSLFLLAKIGQSILSHALWSIVRRVPQSPWTLRRVVRTAGIHLAIQPLGLFLLALSTILVIPTGWVVVYFQTATLLAGEPHASRAEVARESWDQMKRSPGLNHAIVGMLSTFGFFVFINLLLLTGLGPQLLKMFLGIETVFSRSPWSILNSTVLATLGAFTLLALDPFLKAAYVLHCFHVRARRSGEDLLAQLRSLQRSGLTIWIALLFSVAGHLQAAAPAEPSPPAARSESPIDSSAINRSAELTLQKREYLWRLPHQKLERDSADSTGVWTEFWKGVGARLQSAMQWIEQTIQSGLSWLRKVFGSGNQSSQAGNFLFDWGSPLSVLSKLLIIASAIALISLLFRAWKEREPKVPNAVVSATSSTVNLADETVQAVQLPEDEWLRLARELRQSGDLRLAMRALYFATLTRLASRGLLQLTRFKSNRDYQIELRRRAHALPEVFSAFSENMFRFERVWYGAHAIEAESLTDFESRVQHIHSSLTP